MNESSQPSPDTPAAPASSAAATSTVAANITLSVDGTVQGATPEAATWWRAGGLAALVGRPFAGLFFFEAPAGAGDPVVEAWRLLEAAASTRPLTLQARVEGGGFEAVVHLTPAAEGAGYTARIERTDIVPAPAALAPVPTPAPPSARTPVAEPPLADAPLAADEEGNAELDDFETDPTVDEPLVAEVEEDGDDFLDDDDTDEEDSDEASNDDAADGEELDAEDSADEEELADDVAGEDDLSEAIRVAIRPALAEPADWSGWEGGNVGLFELDFVLGTARYSEAWRRLLGYEADDVADETDTFGALFHPEDSEAAPGPETKGRRNVCVPYSAEARLRAKDGTWRWMQFEGMQTFGADGTLARLTGIMLDAQERHDIEEEMGRAEDRLRHLLGGARHGFFELDLAADTGMFSPEFRHTLGFSAHKLAATPDGFLRLLPPEDAEPGLEAFFNLLVDSGTGLTRRLRLRHRDGRELEFDVMLGVQRDRRRAIQQVLGVIAPADASAVAGAPADTGNIAPATTTATEKLAEAARFALDAVGEAVLLTDESGNVAHANVRAIQWAGGDPEKIVGRPIHEIYVLVDRANGVPAPEVVRRVLEGGSSLELDHRYALIDAAGDRADVVITCRALHNVRKRVSGGIVILRKPSEMPLTPAELVASNRMETLGRLACGIAHDFNNILTTVTGSISLATDKREWEPLAPAQKALGTARNLARQLLTFARGDAAEKKVQSINDVIKETARLTSAGSKSSVTLELSADVHPVNLDPVRIIQVFTNLILNAMQVMPAGGRIWVRTQNMRLGQVNSVALSAGDYVRVEVQDNGPGIPAENLEHIFEPFFSTRSGGTGLGLAMVRSIITQHEGAIEVASTIGTGTTFTLYFPRASTEPVKETTKPMAVTYGTGRILIMDDDADLCMVAKGMLEVLGYEAETATSGEAAIAAVRKYREMGRRYSAVILDLTMAGGPGGEDVLPKLREIDPDIIAIVSSGYATDDQIEKYQQLGFRAMLAKPYRSGDLGRVLKDALSPTK